MSKIKNKIIKNLDKIRKLNKKNKIILFFLIFLFGFFLIILGKYLNSRYEDKIYLENIEGKNLIRFEKLKKEIEENKQKSTILDKKNDKIENIFEITGVGKEKIDNNFNEYLEVFGKNLDGISNILIKCAGRADSFDIQKREPNNNSVYKGGDKVSVLVEKNKLESGICQVGTEIGGVWIFSDFNIDVKKNENDIGINLKFITPNYVLSKTGGMIVLQGEGFKKLVAIQIDNGVVLDLEFLEIVSDNVVIVNIPKKIKVGEYFFRFLNEEGVYENKDVKIFIK